MSEQTGLVLPQTMDRYGMGLMLGHSEGGEPPRWACEPLRVSQAVRGGRGGVRSALPLVCFGPWGELRWAAAAQGPSSPVGGGGAGPGRWRGFGFTFWLLETLVVRAKPRKRSVCGLCGGVRGAEGSLRQRLGRRRCVWADAGSGESGGGLQKAVRFLGI